MLYSDNDHADKVGYPTTGSRSQTQVHTNVHCCHCLPKVLPNKGYQTYQRVVHNKKSMLVLKKILGMLEMIDVSFKSYSK